MTNIETTFEWPPVIPGFDVLKWKHENHARMRRETEGLTAEEIRERLRRSRERAEQRRAELSELKK